ncbi:MAG TPA: HAMP domain-containing sensor histidine kinase, partial [Longimicrobiales bacterium]
VASFFPTLLKLAKALPDSLLHGQKNDDILSLRVTTPGGDELFHSPRVYTQAFSATEVLPSSFGALLLRVSLRPEAANILVIGGLPRSRMPLLLGLLAMTLALCVVALQQLRRETELARMREDFVSSVSHELRTPLAQIRMFTETLLLGRTRSDAERRRSLEIIDQEAKRLTHLVENVLRISRAARGISRVVPENVELTAEVITNIESFRLFAVQKRVELRPELQAGVMGVVDRGGLRQMLLNLLDNALKYGPAGQRVVVGLALVEDRARIWVDDEGPGIAPEDRDKVFDPFYRSPRDAGSAVAGSGIGLAVVREIATLHGGRAWAEAAPGGGARITIEIPGAYVRTPVTEGDWVAA